MFILDMMTKDQNGRLKRISNFILLLFGVNGVSVIGHGRAKANAVRLAIKTAKETVENNFITKLNEELSQLDEQI